jgi:hypothetical protein
MMNGLPCKEAIKEIILNTYPSTGNQMLRLEMHMLAGKVANTEAGDYAEDIPAIDFAFSTNLVDRVFKPGLLSCKRYNQQHQ